MKMAGNRRSDIFKDLYLGEFVEVVMAYMKNPERPVIALQGYLLDVDDYNIYLGDTPDEVNMCIPRNSYKFLIISSPDSEIDAIMSTSKPKPEEIN
jgi:hypothetical protein